MTDAIRGAGSTIDELSALLHEALTLADDVDLALVAARIAHAIDTLSAVRLHAPND